MLLTTLCSIKVPSESQSSLDNDWFFLPCNSS